MAKVKKNKGGKRNKKAKGIVSDAAKVYAAYKGAQYVKSGINKVKNYVKNSRPVRAYSKWKTDKDIAKRSEAFINKPVIKELRSIPRKQEEFSVLKPYDTKNNLIAETRKVSLPNLDAKTKLNISQPAANALTHELRDVSSLVKKDSSDPYRLNSRFTKDQNWVKTGAFEKNDINKSLVNLADKTSWYDKVSHNRPEHVGQKNLFNWWADPKPVPTGKGMKKKHLKKIKN